MSMVHNFISSWANWGMLSERVCSSVIEPLILPSVTFYKSWKANNYYYRCSTWKGRGRRWSLSDKALALSLLHSSPKTYRLLQKVFALPSVQTLKALMRNVEVCISTCTDSSPIVSVSLRIDLFIHRWELALMTTYWKLFT